MRLRQRGLRALRLRRRARVFWWRDFSRSSQSVGAAIIEEFEEVQVAKDLKLLADFVADVSISGAVSSSPFTFKLTHGRLRSMNQRQAVIEVMRQNGGYATLGLLYKEALKVPGVTWGTRTPFKSINRIVQDPRHFFRIRPGLWALKDSKNKLPPDLINRPRSQSEHSYYQGLLVELGNLRHLQTFVPKQDRRKDFLGKPLGSIVTVDDMYLFTYREITESAARVDVVWFNERRFPSEFIEVENTTDMHGAFLKFVTLNPFHSVFRVVAPAARRREFESKVSHPSFDSIAKRTKFSSYELVADLHRKASETAALEHAWTDV